MTNTFSEDKDKLLADALAIIRHSLNTEHSHERRFLAILEYVMATYRKVYQNEAAK